MISSHLTIRIHKHDGHAVVLVASCNLCNWLQHRNLGVNYQKDLTARARQGENYRPTDTVGDLIGRALVTTIPLANLWVAVFCFGPEYLGNFFRRIGALFNQPLVPKKK